MIQDDDPRQSDERSASASSDHISPKRNTNKPDSCRTRFGGTDVVPIATNAHPTSITGKAASDSIGFIKGNPKSNKFFHPLYSILILYTKVVIQRLSYGYTNLSSAMKKVLRLAPTIATAIMIYARYARPCITENNGAASVRKSVIVVTVIAITTPPFSLCTCLDKP